MERRYRIIALLLSFGLLFTGCAKTPKVAEIGVHRAENLPFEDAKGSITVIFEEPIIKNNQIVDGVFDVIVMAKELNPNAEFEVSIIGSNSQGVSFGPEGNVDLKLGTMVGETTFQPNENGELFVSMQNPLRIVSMEEEVRVIVTMDGKEVLRSEPFRFER